MKNLILSFLLLSFFAIGCGGNSTSQRDEQAAREKENLEFSNEADSISLKIESVKTEIEQSSEKLDSLIDDL